MSNLRICKKCMLRGISDEDLNITIQNHINNIDAEERADQKEYDRRLMICKDCDHIFNGMCRKCGCYVEFRAALKNSGCPDSNRWN